MNLRDGTIGRLLIEAVLFTSHGHEMWHAVTNIQNMLYTLS